MAWQDIKLRYRGSVLGPFWLTLSMAIMIAALGIVYSALFKLDTTTYVPFLTLGLLVWTFLATSVTDGCNCFTQAEAIIRQVKLPYTVYVHRTICRNLIVLAHNVVVYLLVMVLYGVPLGWNALTALPALVVLVVNTCWIALLLGMVCARFRDVTQIVSSAVQIIFFMTPIFWTAESLGGRHLWFVNLNPVNAMVSIVRAPLLGEAVPMQSWFMVLVITVVGAAATFAMFVRYRARIPFWV